MEGYTPQGGVGGAAQPAVRAQGTPNGQPDVTAHAPVRGAHVVLDKEACPLILLRPRDLFGRGVADG